MLQQYGEAWRHLVETSIEGLMYAEAILNVKPHDLW